MDPLRSTLFPAAIASPGPLTACERAVAHLFRSAAPSVAYIDTKRVELIGFFTEQIARGACA